MKRIHVSELEGGDDHEFLVRLYTHVLDRWPDRDGYSHYLARIEGKPEARLSVIRDVAASGEARKLDIEVIFPAAAPPMEAAPPLAAPEPPAPAPMLGAGRPGASFAPPGYPAPPGFGAPPAMAGAATALATISAEVAALRAQVLRLEAEVAALRAAQR